MWESSIPLPIPSVSRVASVIEDSWCPEADSAYSIMLNFILTKTVLLLQDRSYIVDKIKARGQS